MEVFGQYRQLEAISDLETVDVYRKLIDSIEDDNVLKRFKSDKYYEKNRLKNLFDLMKKENLSPDYLIERIDKELEDAKTSDEFRYKRNGKNFKKGDFKEKDFKRFETKKLETKAAVEEFEKFNQLMLDHERYDYNDMILWVLREFEKNESLLIQYQERYQYFLVDEYQDTNGAQNAILNKLISYWNDPNVFVVGDDDQAIFKFQGANLRNMIEFKERYDPHTIVLVENYRSNQLILNVSKQLISNNKERIINEDAKLSKDIIASGPFKDDTTMPKILAFTKISEELSYVASEIDKIKSNTEDLSQIAIIYRKHKQVEELINIFEKRNIPYNVKRRIDILKLPFVKKILNILYYLTEEYSELNSASSRLFGILNYDFFGISAHDVAKITHFASHRKYNPEQKKIREIITDEKLLESAGVKNKELILEVSAKLENWISSIPDLTVQEHFEKILNEAGILSYIMKNDQRAWLLQLTGTLFDFIKDETAKDPDSDLGMILEKLEKMKENRIELAVNKNISSEKGVHFVTAHSAKGLEFKKVFILGCTKDIWDKKGNMRDHYSYPEGVNSSSELNTEDERRLFYVAMTRAMTDLNICYSEKNEMGKDLGASLFVDQVLELETLQLERAIVPEEDLIQFYYDIFRSFEKKISLVDPELINDWLQNYVLSVTHLNKYLKCPLSFYFENILRVPSARNPHIGYGQAMHDALRAFLENFKAKRIVGKAPLQQFFIESMNKYRSHFTNSQFEDYMTLGKKTLDKIYDDRVEKWFDVPKMALEEEISHTEVKGIPIKGFLDKVEIYDKYVHVVDYKTGKVSPAKTKEPSDKYPNGGDYWRQLVFYKILLDSDTKHNWNMTSAEIDYLEPDRSTGKFSNVVYNVNRKDIDIVTQQIVEVFENIKNHKFDKGCGEDDCYWCNFVEENDLSLEE